MKEVAPTPLTAYSLTDPRWELAQRVADASNFRNCPKLRAFLLYICENALLGRLENVRELRIGTRVFGRPADYNLNEDNIVRVEARELRKRLETYFAGDGRNEPLLIEVPKGGYVPVFKPREIASLELVEPAAVPQLETKLHAPSGRKLVLVAGFAILTAAVLWLGVENRRLHQRVEAQPGIRPAASAEDYSFYSELLGKLGATPNRETLLVISNPKVVLYYGSATNQPNPTLPGLTIRAPKELKANFDDALNNVDRNQPFHFLRSTREDYTGMGEAVTAFYIGRLMQSLQRPVRLTQGRFLSWDHVQKGDLILLGGPQINDWTYQNIVKANFNFDENGVENLKPLPGEQQAYVPHANPGAVTDYGVIRMAASPYGFNMLLMAGCSSAGTAGVGEFFSNPEKMKFVYNRMRAAAPGKPFPANWEILVQVNVRDALPVESSAIALRPAPDAR
ncbi:MAG TPA: hypothetical protein VK335_33940 [Bryobacteraceae bacterium]|nr:hypothetical protein [Bryobacteraceae bacterium]